MPIRSFFLLLLLSIAAVLPVTAHADQSEAEIRARTREARQMIVDGDPNGAASALSAYANNRSTNSDTLLALGEAALAAGDWERAIAALNAAIEAGRAQDNRDVVLAGAFMHAMALEHIADRRAEARRAWDTVAELTTDPAHPAREAARARAEAIDRASATATAAAAVRAKIERRAAANAAR